MAFLTELPKQTEQLQFRSPATDPRTSLLIALNVNPSNVVHIYIKTWRHQMEISFTLLALCEGNPLVTGGFPSQRPVTRSFDVFFDLRLYNRDAGDLRRHRAHYDVNVMRHTFLRIGTVPSLDRQCSCRCPNTKPCSAISGSVVSTKSVAMIYFKVSLINHTQFKSSLRETIHLSYPLNDIACWGSGVATNDDIFMITSHNLCGVITYPCPIVNPGFAHRYFQIGPQRCIVWKTDSIIPMQAIYLSVL